jgi:predicted ABC-type ATPase
MVRCVIFPAHLTASCVTVISLPCAVSAAKLESPNDGPSATAQEAGVVHFVNPDLIASGLSPLRPELATIAAARIFLRELNRLAKGHQDFAFESTLSGLAYLNRLKRWKPSGYRIEIIYLRISSPQLALQRIAARVNKAGTTWREPM